MKTHEQKLNETEAALKRWLSRGMRAQNMINKLLKQQRRLRKPPLTEKTIEAKAELVQAVDDQLTNIIEGKPVNLAKVEELAIPAFLDRSNPEFAKKAAALDAARRKMPLSGRDALKAIRRGSKRKP